MSGAPTTATETDRARERDLWAAASQRGWTELRSNRLVTLPAGGLAAQAWWNRVSKRFEWDLVAPAGAESAGWTNAATPSGHEDDPAVALDTAAGELLRLTEASGRRSRVRRRP